jgi:hypothetical protein
LVRWFGLFGSPTAGHHRQECKLKAEKRKVGMLLHVTNLSHPGAAPKEGSSRPPASGDWKGLSETVTILPMPPIAFDVLLATIPMVLLTAITKALQSPATFGSAKSMASLGIPSKTPSDTFGSPKRWWARLSRFARAPNA